MARANERAREVRSFPDWPACNRVIGLGWRDNEVMDWVIPFGKGRVYTTMLGHLWKNGPDTAMRCVGFQTMLIRGVEWAATRKVSYPVPDDFPTASEIRLRSGGEAADPEPPDGFKAVFNGHDLSGWEGSPALRPKFQAACATPRDADGAGWRRREGS